MVTKTKPRPFASGQCFHTRRAVRHRYHLTGKRGSDGELALQVIAVDGDDDLEAPQLLVRAYLATKHHGATTLSRYGRYTASKRASGAMRARFRDSCPSPRE